MKRALILLNRRAGVLRRDRGAATERALVAACARSGLAARIERVRAAELPDRLHQAAGAGYDCVAIGGGDGSLRAAAEVLAGGPVPLGILPLGTLNHFARDLGIPAGLEAAVRALAAGRVAAIDVAEVNGRVFLNNCSIGAYPFLVRVREHQRRRFGWGRWPAMLLAALRLLRRLPVLRLGLRTDGGEWRHRTPSLFIGNNRYRPSLLAPGRGALDRGELCIFVALAHRPLQLLGLALRAALGRLDPQRDLAMVHTEAAEVTSRRRLLRVALDGEVVYLRPPLACRVRRGALRVLVPAGAP